MSLFLCGEPAADELLSTEPLALLLGMVLDQQIPMERAFRAPFDLKERLGGTLDAARIAAMPTEELVELFRMKPALHRFPQSMAKRVQEVCAVVADEYDGDAAALWSEVTTGEELLDAVLALPGFGEQKTRIFTALLGKQLHIQPPGWVEATHPYGEPGTFLSVADIDSPEALAKVRTAKQAAKAEARAKVASPG